MVAGVVAGESGDLKFDAFKFNHSMIAALPVRATERAGYKSNERVL